MEILKKPPWLRKKIPNSETYLKNLKLITKNNLNTVCTSANCPNIEECFKNNKATFMILGNNCTRNCKYCNISNNHPDKPDPDEPKNIVNAIRMLNLKYAVITSVTRDDLPDCGVNHFIKCIKEIKSNCPETKIEILIPDFKGKQDLIDKLIRSEPDVINHNIETVKELFKEIRPMGNYITSINNLKYIKSNNPNILTKSGLMLGFGESLDDLKNCFIDLKASGIDILTIGQYMQPSKKHYPVKKFYTPEEFKKIGSLAEKIGIQNVFSAPLIRSSYGAEDIFNKIKHRNNNTEKIIRKKIKDGKLLEVLINYDSKNLIINKIILSGDFFMHPESAIELLENHLIKKKISVNLEKYISEFLNTKEIQIIGFSSKDLTDSILECVK